MDKAYRRSTQASKAIIKHNSWGTVSVAEKTTWTGAIKMMACYSTEEFMKELKMKDLRKIFSIYGRDQVKNLNIT